MALFICNSSQVAHTPSAYNSSHIGHTPYLLLRTELATVHHPDIPLLAATV